MAKKPRRRLDAELVAQGYFGDVSQALRAVMAGEVSCRGERLTHPGASVEQGCELHVKGSPRASRLGRGRYVGRGGIKLEGALDAFGLDVAGKNCLDIGCSTGGFTDCLIKAGAARVAAVDVGYGQFDWGLRGDPRVALFERTNICEADPEALGAPFDVVVCDVSFTSISNILPAVLDALEEQGSFCTLIKPQFEAERSEVGEGGVVDDPSVHERVLGDVVRLLASGGLPVAALAASPIRGAKGNREFFALARRGATPVGDTDILRAVESAWRGNEGDAL